MLKLCSWKPKHNLIVMANRIYGERDIYLGLSSWGFTKYRNCSYFNKSELGPKRDYCGNTRIAYMHAAIP